MKRRSTSSKDANGVEGRKTNAVERRRRCDRSWQERRGAVRMAGIEDASSRAPSPTASASSSTGGRGSKAIGRRLGRTPIAGRRRAPGPREQGRRRRRPARAHRPGARVRERRWKAVDAPALLGRFDTQESAARPPRATRSAARARCTSYDGQLVPRKTNKRGVKRRRDELALFAPRRTHTSTKTDTRRRLRWHENEPVRHAAILEEASADALLSIDVPHRGLPAPSNSTFECKDCIMRRRRTVSTG